MLPTHRAGSVELMAFMTLVENKYSLVLLGIFIHLFSNIFLKMQKSICTYLFSLLYVTSFVSFINRYSEVVNKSKASLKATLMFRDLDEATNPDAIRSLLSPLFGYKPTISPTLENIKIFFDMDRMQWMNKS